MSILALFLILFSAANSKKAKVLYQDSPERIPNRYIVVFKTLEASVLEQEHANAKQLYGERIKYVYKHALNGFAVELLELGRELEMLRRNPGVDWIEADQVARIGACAQEEFGSWGQTRIAQRDVNLDGQYEAPGRGKGVNAYILDTGIYVEHSDFGGRAKFAFKAETSWTNTDGNGHGTHVSSTVGGKVYGIAKEVDLFAVKVLSDQGSGSYAGVIAGVDFVAGQHRSQNKPSVANMSLGGPKSAALNAAIQSAVESNVIFVVAAGNDNNNACNYSPASTPDAITVGATDVGDNAGSEVDIRSYFSNFGTCVDIFAPGSAITAAWIGGVNRIHTISGTSMASPHVCGMAAVLLGINPKMTWHAVANQLQSDASNGIIDLQCAGSSICLSTQNLLAYNTCAAKKRAE